MLEYNKKQCWYCYSLLVTLFQVFKDKSLYEFHHPRVAKRSLGHSQYHTDNLQGHTKVCLRKL